MNARAEVIVFANKTDQSVTFGLIHPDKKIQGYRIASGDVLPVLLRGPATIRFNSGSRWVNRPSVLHSIYTFVNQGQLDLVEQRFDGDDDNSSTVRPTIPLSYDGPLDRVGTLPVMILVDEDEPAVRRLWEARLRNRMRNASRIFERQCRMRIEVVAVGTWESNDTITDFSLSLREFEREARLQPPACLAVGFTSQYRKPDRRRVHLGGTRGPLYSHLLVREWSQHITEPERLEVLVHELGHVLGASHSGDPTSVMRPMVGDRQSRARSFRIGFDPLNTLALNIFCEQIRLGNARRLADFSPASRQLLASVYREMHRQLPGDTAATRYLTLLERAGRRPRSYRIHTLTTATQSVVRAVTRAALINHARAEATDSPSAIASRLDGDSLTDYYIRAAASEASRLPDYVAQKAFCLGLVVALSKSDTTNLDSSDKKPRHAYETPQQRRRRLAVLGKPTIHGREDLLQHFVASAALCSTIGASGAESVATLKEIADSRGASGFSFADLAADTAGIELSKRLDESRLSLDTLASSFKARHFLLAPDVVPKDTTFEAFKETYGSVSDPRFRQRSELLRNQVLALPGYSDRGSQ